MARSQYHFHNHNSTSHSYVTEKRAPTDESVRLLKEMESEAKQKIVDSIVVNNTEFECSIQKMLDGINDMTLYCVVYRMNGRKSMLEVAIPNWQDLSDIDVMIKIRDELAKDIAATMIDSVLRDAQSRNLFLKGY